MYQYLGPIQAVSGFVFRVKPRRRRWHTVTSTWRVGFRTTGLRIYRCHMRCSMHAGLGHVNPGRKIFKVTGVQLSTLLYLQTKPIYHSFDTTLPQVQASECWIADPRALDRSQPDTFLDRHRSLSAFVARLHPTRLPGALSLRISPNMKPKKNLPRVRGGLAGEVVSRPSSDMWTVSTYKVRMLKLLFRIRRTAEIPINHESLTTNNSS